MPNPFSAAVSRRRFLGVGAAGLAAAGLGAAGMQALGVRAAPAQPASPAQVSGPQGPLPAASLSSAQMTAAAQAFLAGLSADQLASVQYPDLGNNVRTTWSNLPNALSPRVGVALGDLSDSQRILLHNLLRASTSSQGYLKLTGAIRADQLLSELQGGDPQYGAANYFTTVFG